MLWLVGKCAQLVVIVVPVVLHLSVLVVLPPVVAAGAGVVRILADVVAVVREAVFVVPRHAGRWTPTYKNVEDLWRACAW